VRDEVSFEVKLSEGKKPPSSDNSRLRRLNSSAGNDSGSFACAGATACLEATCAASTSRNGSNDRYNRGFMMMVQREKGYVTSPSDRKSAQMIWKTSLC
jgi:hypothetical protein